MLTVTSAAGASLAGGVGLLLGSFLNVVAHRLPRGESLSVPASVTVYVESQGVSIAASQEVIVPQSAGAVLDIPRMPRLGIRPPR